MIGEYPLSLTSLLIPLFIEATSKDFFVRQSVRENSYLAERSSVPLFLYYYIFLTAPIGGKTAVVLLLVDKKKKVVNPFYEQFPSVLL